MKVRNVYKLKMDTLIAWGASVVIVGLMFKLLHWEGGYLLIGVGLGVEAFLFFIIGLNALKVTEPVVDVEETPESGLKMDIIDRLAGSQNVERMKQSFDHFANNVQSLNKVTETAAFTQDMMKEMDVATQQIKQMHKNLSELNAYYVAQLEVFKKPTV